MGTRPPFEAGANGSKTKTGHTADRLPKGAPGAGNDETSRLIGGDKIVRKDQDGHERPEVRKKEKKEERLP